MHIVVDAAWKFVYGLETSLFKGCHLKAVPTFGAKNTQEPKKLSQLHNILLRGLTHFGQRMPHLKLIR